MILISFGHVEEISGMVHNSTTTRFGVVHSERWIARIEGGYTWRQVGNGDRMLVRIVNAHFVKVGVSKELASNNGRVHLENADVVLDPVRDTFIAVRRNVTNDVDILVVDECDLQLRLHPVEHVPHVLVFVSNPEVESGTVVHVEHDEAKIAMHQ